jgi:hypothetical protein
MGDLPLLDLIIKLSDFQADDSSETVRLKD